MNVSQQNESGQEMLWMGKLHKHSSDGLISDDAHSDVDVKVEEIEQKNKHFVGKTDDSVWWNDIKDEKDENKIYNTLVENMGVFRWQNPQHVLLDIETLNIFLIPQIHSGFVPL